MCGNDNARLEVQKLMKKYEVVVFDVDGTLIDTQETILLSLQHMLFRMTGRLYPFEELYFALGIPGDKALDQLKIEDKEKAMRTWLIYDERYGYLQKPFDGIKELISWLEQKKIRLGIVTSRTREEFRKSVAGYEFMKSFETIICADDTKKHKPDPEPMLELLKRMHAEPSRVLYIGDSSYDMECARGAGVDSALAVWGACFTENIQADYKMEKINDIKSLFI